MNTCQYCGSALTEGLKFCPSCGAQVPQAPQADNSYAQQQYQQPYQQQQQYQQQYQQPMYAAPAQQPVDSGSIGWGVLGFFIPLVGLILFLVWKDTKPNSAKVAGIGAIIGVVVGILANIGTLAQMGAI